MVKWGGTRMTDGAKYSVIVDRISHEVEYYRGALKHAVLRARTSSTTRSGGRPTTSTSTIRSWRSSGCAIPKTVLLPQKGYPKDIDLTPESLRNLEYPIDWDALLDYVGRPAILKPYSGGGWKHVYKVNDRQRTARGLRRHGAVLHDAAGVHRLRVLRSVLHLRQDRHHPGAIRSARATISDRSCVPVV